MARYVTYSVVYMVHKFVNGAEGGDIKDDQMQKWRALQLAMDLPEFEEVDASWGKFYD